MRKKILAMSPREFRRLLESYLQKDSSVNGSLLPGDRFKARSEEMYTRLNTISSERFSLEGSFTGDAAVTVVRYKGRGNATFRTLALVLPVMMLPVLLVGATGQGDFDVRGLIIYLCLSGTIVAVLLWQDRRLAREGEAKFSQWLQSLSTISETIEGGKSIFW